MPGSNKSENLVISGFCGTSFRIYQGNRKSRSGLEVMCFHSIFLGAVLRQGKWNGSTLLPTLTEIFDCPDKYERKYRKNPISLNFPTCSILACTTQAWFWRDVTESDFEGGFGNRF